MTWHDFKLSAPTEDNAKWAATAALSSGFELIGQEGHWIIASHNHAFDPIGTRWNGDGVYGPEGETITPPTQMDGWFANLRVRSDMASEVGAVLSIAGAPFGVTVVAETGREWA